MLRNYFKTAFRHLKRNKLYTACNIAGLAIGISSCLLIGIYIWHEMSFDRFHENGNRLVRVTWEYNFGTAPVKTVLTGTKAGPELNRRFPEVESFVRLLKYERVVGLQDRMFREKKFLYADSAFFSMFSFPLLKGDKNTVLDGPDKLVITSSAAKKYFGKDDPLGKTIKVGIKDFLITGVAADAPDNSQLKFDFVGSFSSLNAAKTEKWSEANYITYLLLRHPGEVEKFQNKVNAFTKDVTQNEMHLPAGQYMAFHLEPMSDVHLHSNLDGIEPNNNIRFIYILGLIALLILVIACINYTNLATAQSAGRSAEIGMRKVLGAEKKQVFLQFITESLLLSFFAVIVALAMAMIFLPFFNQLAGKNISPDIFGHPYTILALVLCTVVVAFVSGAYPSMVLSNSRLAGILKSGFSFTGSSKGFRKSLIVFQFAVSVFLIISTLVILQQLSYIRNKDLGYNREHVIVLPIDSKITEHYDDIKAALAATPGVKNVSGAYEEPVDIGWGDGISTKDNKELTVNAFPVDEDIVKTLGLTIVSGSDYTVTDVKQFDTSNNGENIRYSFMLNESAVRALGWTPENAVGRTIAKGHDGVIKAVVKDFHFRSLHESISPLVIFLDKRLVNNFFIKVSAQNLAATLAALGNNWKQRIIHRPFEYHFLDEDYNNLYQTEQRTAGVFTAFSTLAIMLACLGLFALTAYTMVQRTKEIGIRKVLGATVTNILRLVSADFLKLVVIALLIASPIAYWLMTKWLQDFSYKINIGWWVFAVAGISCLLIAFITISLQAIKIALANPVKSLRSE